MRIRSTAILAAVLAVLCAGYWAWTRFEKEEARQIAEAKRIVDFDTKSIVRIEVRRAGQEPVQAERDAAGAWVITKPDSDVSADTRRWESMAEAVAGMVNERTIGAGGDLTAYGLAAPELVVVADTADGRGIRVAFGSMEPIQVNRYARVDDGQVILISNETFKRLNRSLNDLRDRRVFHFAPDEILRIEFARIWNGRGEAPAGAPIELGAELGRAAVERESAAAPWRVVEPVDAPADQERIALMLEMFPNAMGKSYIDSPESLADYGLEPPWARLTLVAGEGRAPETLLLGSADLEGAYDNGVFVKKDGESPVFTIEPQLMNALPLTRTHFRDARLITRPLKGLNGLHYVAQGVEFVLQKFPEQGWQMTMPPAEQTDQVAVSTLIGNLVQLSVLDFPAGGPAEFGLEEPVVVITLGFDQEAPVELRFAPGPGGSKACFATQDTGAVSMLPAEALEMLARSPADFQTFELLRFNRAEAVEMKISYEGTNYTLENRGGVWQVVSPEQVALQNQDDARTILNALSPLTAEQAIPLEAGALLAPFGLDVPVFSGTVTTLAKEAPDQPIVHGPVFIGGPVDGQPQRRYAMVGGRSGVYVIKQAIFDQIREGMRGIQPKTAP